MCRHSRAHRSGDCRCQFSRIAKTLQKKGRDVPPIHPLFLWNTTKSSEPGVVNIRLSETKPKKNPAKSGVLLVRESTISGRLQLSVYLHLRLKSNIIMPDHHASSASRVAAGASGFLNFSERPGRAAAHYPQKQNPAACGVLPFSTPDGGGSGGIGAIQASLMNVSRVSFGEVQRSLAGIKSYAQVAYGVVPPT